MRERLEVLILNCCIYYRILCLHFAAVTGGYCSVPNECICRQGYGGTNCGTGDVQCLHVWGVHGVGILECGIGIQNAPLKCTQYRIGGTKLSCDKQTHQ